MLIDIRSGTRRISSGLSTFVHRTRDLSLGRFRNRIREVVVRIVADESNTPRECEVKLRLSDRSHVIARGRATDLYGAINRAFARAARAVARRRPPPRLPRALSPLLPASSN